MRFQITTTNTQSQQSRARTEIESNPLLKSLHDQVDLMLQRPSSQNVKNIFFAVILAIDKNLSNPNSPLSMNSDPNELRRLFNFPYNDRMRLTLNLSRSPQQPGTSPTLVLEKEEKKEEISNLDESTSF